MVPVDSERAPAIRKIALVSHDYNVSDAEGRWDYARHFERINARCDREGCDTILYALYTLDSGATKLDHDRLFGKLTNVNLIIVETGDLDLACEEHGHLTVEVWRRGCERPLVLKQQFAASGAPETAKSAFMAHLSDRLVGDALVAICGETNIASTVRGQWSDPHGFGSTLDALRVRVLLNPIHDYMPWPAMLEKRRRYSSGRVVVSVWNAGRPGESARVPWTVFQDGIDRTDAVYELPMPLTYHPDVRIGILSVLGPTLQVVKLDADGSLTLPVDARAVLGPSGTAIITVGAHRTVVLMAKEAFQILEARVLEGAPKDGLTVDSQLALACEVTIENGGRITIPEHMGLVAGLAESATIEWTSECVTILRKDVSTRV